MIDIFLIPMFAAIFLAVNMGGSGVAAAFSTSYGSKLIRKDLIPGLFGAFVFLGAIVSSESVVNTIGNGIVDESFFDVKLTSILLISIGISILVANLLKVPQSTSQSTIFALLGIGVYFDSINTEKLLYEIVPAWIILPIIAFVVTLIIGKMIYNPIKNSEIIDFASISNHSFIRYLVILSSCYVAYAIGSNNVANASGPILALLDNSMNFNGNNMIMIIIATLLIAPWFGIGGSIFSSRVLETTGNKIINFGPLGAFSISIVTGTLLIFASVISGIPAALAQINIGAILGLGVYKEGFRHTFSKRTVQRIFIVWIIAPIIAFLITFILLYIFF